MVAALKYKPPGAVAKAFMLSDAFVRGIRGPVGSGKSTTCCVEILRKARAQKPNKQGVRRSRWAIVRNTNPELRTTTIKTWLDLFPEDEWGDFKWSVPYTHQVNFDEPDGTRVELEVLFLALDTQADVKKLLSLELTGVWGNEARELPKAVIDGMTMRVGRFPSMREGGPTWKGVILDTNAPDEDHWWPILAGEAPIPDYIADDERLMLKRPHNWAFFNQPGAMREIRQQKTVVGYEVNPEAENYRNLTPNYYENMLPGKTKAWINIYVLNRLGAVNDGRPVYPSFRDEVHVATAPLVANPELPIHVGLDFGLTPAAVFGQRTARGQWTIVHELVTSDMGIKRFGQLLKAECARVFPEHRLDQFMFHGDPAGDARGHDESTAFQILRSPDVGIRAIPAPTNDPVVRVEAVELVLSRMIDGIPGLLVSPTCTVIRRGMAGGYHYKRMAIAGEARFDEKPAKNRYSHPCDAKQYMLVGAGEGRTVMNGGRETRTTVAPSGASLWQRRQGGIMDRRAGSRPSRF